MNILQSLFGAKNMIAERAGGYSDALVGSLRNRSDEWSGQAQEYSEDAAGKAADAAEALDDWRQTPAGRIGLWIGLGVAILGGALYAWKLYQDMQAEMEAENTPNSNKGAATQRKANSSQSSLKEKVGMPTKASTSSVKKTASTVGSPKSKAEAATRTTSAQTPKADRVKAKSQHTAHFSSEAAKSDSGASKPAAKTPKSAKLPSGTGAKAIGRAATDPSSSARKPRASGR